MFSDVISMFELYPLSFYITIAVLSLTIGSFLNVVIYRFPKMLEQGWYAECREFLADEVKGIPENKQATITLSTPNSTCPKCDHQIRFYENIPIISWVFLKGKCSACKNSISARYPLIEATTALLSVVIVNFSLFSKIKVTGIYPSATTVERSRLSNISFLSISAVNSVSFGKRF